MTTIIAKATTSSVHLSFLFTKLQHALGLPARLLVALSATSFA